MAATTIVVTPNIYSPVGADMWFGLSSVYSGLKDFKYIFDLNQIDLVSGASTTIGSYKVPPRPVNSYGLISPSKLLKPLMNWSFSPTIVGPYTLTQGVIKYGFYYGSIYNPGSTFSDIQDYSGHAQLVNSGSVLDIQTDDIITILMDNNADFYYNGEFLVLDAYVSGPNQLIEIDQTYVNSVYVQTGTITSIKRYDGNSANYYAYQGTRQYNEISTNFTNERVILAATASKQYLLSNYKNLSNVINSIPANNAGSYIYGNTKSIYANQYETISFLIDPSATQSYIRIETYNANYGTTSIYESSLYSSLAANGKYIRYDYPSGTANLVSGYYVDPIVMASASYYSIAIVNKQAGINYLKCIRFYEIVPNCSPYSKNYRLVFMNRHGGSDYWNFNWKATNIVNQQTTLFRKQLAYNYSVGDRQDTVLSNKANETYIVSSYWISESDSNFLKELLTSPDVYVYDEVLNQKLPIIILDTQYQVKTAIDNKLFCITINFRYAYDINLQTN